MRTKHPYAGRPRAPLAVLATTAAAIGASLLLANAALAQAYPAKPVRIVNPYQAGGAGDIVFRQLLPSLEAKLGQRIVVENRTGAGGNIGTQAVVQSPPDGYTLLLGATNNFAINQFVFPKLGFDPLTALAPATIVADVPSVFYVNPQAPGRTLRDFVDWARANPGKINYSSPGSGTTPHLNVELLAQMTDMKLVHVPYRGLPDAMAAVVAGDVQLYLAGAAAGRGHVQAGKLRAFAVGSRARLPALPDVPTIAEAGIPDLEASNWFALAAPAGTPAAILERWAEAVRAAAAEPETARRFAETGFLPGGTSPAATRARIVREAALWQGVVRRAGVKAD